MKKSRVLSFVCHQHVSPISFMLARKKKNALFDLDPNVSEQFNLNHFNILRSRLIPFAIHQKNLSNFSNGTIKNRNMMELHVHIKLNVYFFLHPVPPPILNVFISAFGFFVRVSFNERDLCGCKSKLFSMIGFQVFSEFISCLLPCDLNKNK